MKRLMMVLAVLAMVIVAVGNIPTSQAQDGLTDDEKALVERFFNAVENVDEYDAYVLETSELQSQDLTASIAGFEMGQTSSVLIETTQTVTLGGDNINLLATLAVDTAETGPAGGDVYSFTAQVEGRLVDGVVYVNAQYLESEGTLPELPEGWFELDALDFDVAELLSDLNLENWLDDEDMVDTPFENVETFIAAVSEITLAQETLDDGTEVDVITAVLGSDGLMDMLAESGSLDLEDPTAVALLGMMGDNFDVSFQVKLDSEDNPRYAVIAITIDLVDLNMDEMGIEGMPPGGSMSMVMSMQEVRQWSNINDPALQPVEAPELAQ